MKTLFTFLLVIVLFSPAQADPSAEAAMLMRAPQSSGGGLPTPISQWPFHGNTTDVIGGNNGTPVGSPGYVIGADGFANHAISFNGTSQAVGTSSAPTGTIMTMTCWVNYAGGTEGHFFEYGPLQCWMQTSAGVGQINFYSGSAPATVNTTISLNAWHFLSFVGNSTGHFVYIDGALASDAGDTSPLSTPTASFIFGEYRGGSFWWAGAMQDARYYNVALTGTQIAALYAAGAQ